MKITFLDEVQKKINLIYFSGVTDTFSQAVTDLRTIHSLRHLLINL